MANKEDIERFLHYIKQIESSNGRNVDHPVVEQGLNKGDSAKGIYGMMPKTMTSLGERYPSAFSEDSKPEDYAPYLANEVLDKAKGDETLAAGLWNQGEFSDPEKYEDIREKNINAVKYDKLRSEIPYALDPNPYRKEYADELEEKNRFPQLGKIFKK